MTTIAYRDRVLAGDTRAVDSSGLCSRVVKVTKRCISHPIQLLIGCTGATSIANRLRWTLEEMALDEVNGKTAYGLADRLLRFDPIKIDEKDECGMLVVVGDVANVYVLRKLPHCLEWVHEPYVASGSGRDFALSAMKMGRTAPEAVAFANEFDLYTGPEVMSVSL